MSTAQRDVSMVCMDCDHMYRRGAPNSTVSHGLCILCFANRVGAISVPEVADLVEAQLEQLPIGTIVLDETLSVIGYSPAEERLTGLNATRLYGKSFFSDVAPCMDADEVGGWCRCHVLDKTLSMYEINWYLPLKTGGRVATLELCAGRGRVIIRVDVSGKNNQRIPSNASPSPV